MTETRGYAIGDRVYVSIVSLYHPSAPWRVLEYTEVSATVTLAHTHPARGAEVIVKLDHNPRGPELDGWGFPPELIRPLAGAPHHRRFGREIVN